MIDSWLAAKEGKGDRSSNPSIDDRVNVMDKAFLIGLYYRG